MNRPVKPKPSIELSFEEYMCAESNWEKEIEKYCDELEQSNKSLSNAYDDCLTTLHFWEEEYHKYRKALDKACSKLEEINVCPHMTKKEWKEWSSRDE